MKKVLIITYYWAPSGGAGVQRWVKTAKYLREFGYEPVVYTPENPEYPSIDHSFERDIPENLEVIKTKIWEPYNIYRSLFGKKGETINAGFISENKKMGWKEWLAIRIRGNLLIPDPRRFWVRPSVKFLYKYLKNNNINAVITTGPPHSMHLIGLRLKNKIPDLQWIADFRDPWTDIDFYQDLHIAPIADFINHRLERKVVQNCDCLVTVSEGWAAGFTPLKPKRLEVISNGFDDEDIPKDKMTLDVQFSIAHIGTLNFARNPHILWKILSEICFENLQFANDLQIKLIGKIDFSTLEDIRNYNLRKNLKKIDYLPHIDAIIEQQKSQILLLLINRSANASGILTGKIYEYLASSRPILAIGPTDGGVAEIMEETRAGKIVAPNDEKAMKTVVLDFYEKYQNGKLRVENQNIHQYSRRFLAGKYAKLLDEIKETRLNELLLENT